MFDCGALTTSTPRAVAAGTSTLSSPMPALATTLSTRRGGQRLGVHRGRRADQDGVGVGERGQQRGAVGAVDVPDLEFRTEHVHRGLGELLGDQHDGLGHSDSSPWVVRWAPVGAGGIRPWCVGPWCRTRARSAVSDRSERIGRPADNASRARSGDEPAATGRWALPAVDGGARSGGWPSAGRWTLATTGPATPRPPISPQPPPGRHNVTRGCSVPLRLWRRWTIQRDATAAWIRLRVRLRRLCDVGRDGRQRDWPSRGRATQLDRRPHMINLAFRRCITTSRGQRR